jgi:hypothetical protein
MVRSDPSLKPEAKYLGQTTWYAASRVHAYQDPDFLEFTGYYTEDGSYAGYQMVYRACTNYKKLERRKVTFIR